jgi:hypothetical protein
MNVTQYSDKVCSTPTKCVDDFTFYLVHEQVGLTPPIEGVLGLS